VHANQILNSPNLHPFSDIECQGMQGAGLCPAPPARGHPPAPSPPALQGMGVLLYSAAQGHLMRGCSPTTGPLPTCAAGRGRGAVLSCAGPPHAQLQHPPYARLQPQPWPPPHPRCRAWTWCCTLPRWATLRASSSSTRCRTWRRARTARTTCWCAPRWGWPGLGLGRGVGKGEGKGLG